MEASGDKEWSAICKRHGLQPSFGGRPICSVCAVEWGLVPGKSQYRPCTRCGLRPASEDSHECSSCAAERLYLSGKALVLPKRKCPVCGKQMSRSTDWETSRLLTCSKCSATFGIEDATLHFKGCDRTGKGTSGTNMKVRNDAKDLLAKSRAPISHEDHAAMWGVTPDLSADELLELFLVDPYTFTKEEALRALWKNGHTAQLTIVATEAEPPWAERARDGLEQPYGNDTVPYFFNEEFNPVPL